MKLIKDISFNRNVRAQCNEEDAILWQKNTYASRIELLDLHIRFVTHINSTNKRNAKRSCIVIEHFITRSIRKITFQKEKKKERLYRSAGKCEEKSTTLDQNMLTIRHWLWWSACMMRSTMKKTPTPTHIADDIIGQSYCTQLRTKVLCVIPLDYLVKVKFLCADFSLLCSIFFLFLGIYFSLFHLSVRTDHCEQFSLLLIFFFFPSIFL